MKVKARIRSRKWERKYNLEARIRTRKWELEHTLEAGTITLNPHHDDPSKKYYWTFAFLKSWSKFHFNPKSWGNLSNYCLSLLNQVDKKFEEPHILAKSVAPWSSKTWWTIDLRVLLTCEERVKLKPLSTFLFFYFFGCNFWIYVIPLIEILTIIYSLKFNPRFCNLDETAEKAKTFSKS